MTVIEAISDRHFLPATGIAGPNTSKLLSVRIIVDDAWARSVAGQLLRHA